MNHDTEQTCRTQNGIVAVRTGRWQEGMRIEMQVGMAREKMLSTEARALAAQLGAAADALEYLEVAGVVR